MLALHPCYQPSPGGALVDQDLVIVIHVTRPGTGLQGEGGGGALEGPDPILVSVVVDADDVRDGLVGGALEVEVAVVVIGPLLTPGTCHTSQKK